MSLSRTWGMSICLQSPCDCLSRVRRSSNPHRDTTHVFSISASGARRQRWHHSDPSFRLPHLLGMTLHSRRRAADWVPLWNTKNSRNLSLENTSGRLRSAHCRPVFDRDFPCMFFKRAVNAGLIEYRAKRKPPERGLIPLFQRFRGGAEGTRTPDPLHAMQVRYQLRHSPKPVSPIRRFPSGPKQLVNLRTGIQQLPNRRGIQGYPAPA